VGEVDRLFSVALARVCALKQVQRPLRVEFLFPSFIKEYGRDVVAICVYGLGRL
jgi:hypothetical protein